MDKDIVHHELKMTQDCIKRMNTNSFYLKGWYISLLFLGANLLAGKNINYIYIVVLVTMLSMVFGYLDAFYLKIETLYRWKYEWLISERIKGNVSYLYNLDPYNEAMWKDSKSKNKHICIINFIFSKTIMPIYCSGIILTLLFS